MKQTLSYMVKAMTKGFLPFYLLTLLPLLASCSQEEITTTAPAQQTLRFDIYDASVTRATTDGSALVTNFELADKAGLYIVKNGQILKENVLLTYNASGFWQAAEIIEATAELSGAQFYAYYPYSTSATFDASSATPFAAMVSAAVPPTAQNVKTDYEAADIMVSPACTIGEYNAVKIPLSHQKAMVCMELPNSSYIFDNENMEPYVLAKAENVKFTLGDAAVAPYFDETSQSYRLIVEPGETRVLKATYTDAGVEHSYSATNLSNIGKGQYAKYVVNGGALLVNMTLEVGDYFCADGRLVKHNATTLPNNIVGVVMKLGTTESISAANSSWSHAVVISLKDVKAKWGNDKSTTTEQNNAGWRYWYRDYNLADQGGQTNASKLDESLMAEEGFEVTKAWRAVPQPLEIGGIMLDYTSLMNETLDAWIAANGVPAGTNTGWYIPSLGDWKNVEAQQTVIDQHFSAAGGAALSTAQYWSCNVRGAGSNWCYVLGKSALADRYKGVACNSSVNYRFLLAF